MGNIVEPANLVRRIPRKVFFTGSTALSAGQGVCYNRATGTAADVDPNRDRQVSLPDNTNNLAFAGVAQYGYSATSGGQWIEINEPGSICFGLFTGTQLTIGQNQFRTMQILGDDQGKFGSPSHILGGGRGVARIMQTTANNAVALVELMTGFESGLAETIPAATIALGGAQTFMTGGSTLFVGGVTPASDVTYTLGNGTFDGQYKMFELFGALTTNDVVVTVTNGIQLDGSTALATLEFDGSGDYTLLQWIGTNWHVIANIGTAEA